MGSKDVWPLSLSLITGLALAVSLAQSKNYSAILAGSLAVALAVIMRRRKWGWRLPTLYFCAAGLVYFYRVFGGMEPNTPGLLSSGAYHPLDAVVLVLCVASAVICAVASFKREQAAA